MNQRWPDEALAFAESVDSALQRLGGVDFARRAEADPQIRGRELGPVMTRLGFPDIDVFGDSASAVAAAAGVRAAGAVVAPWPLAVQLAAPRGADGAYISRGPCRRLEHLDLFDAAIAIDLTTRELHPVTASAPVRPMPLDPFGVDVGWDGGGPSVAAPTEAQRSLDANVVLTAFYVLGALEAATQMAGSYAVEREQFGQTIAKFGAIQWRLSDVALAKDGLTELASYTLWRFSEEMASPADILALRLGMLEASLSVLTNTHQIFGAIGLCEEHDLAVIDRHLQALLRRPGGVASTTRLLGAEIAAHGFDALFPVHPLASPDSSPVG